MPGTTTYCAEHTDTRTNLRCSRCDKPVCPQCMVQAPVGIRCREHGRGQKLPTYEVSRGYLARALGASLGLGVVGGLALAFVVLPALPFVGLFAMAGFGYLVGEGVSRAANRKRGKPLIIVAVAGILTAGCILVAYEMLFYGPGRLLFDLLGLAAAIYIAVSRLR